MARTASHTAQVRFIPHRAFLCLKNKYANRVTWGGEGPGGLPGSAVGMVRPKVERSFCKGCLLQPAWSVTGVHVGASHRSCRLDELRSALAGLCGQDDRSSDPGEDIKAWSRDESPSHCPHIGLLGLTGGQRLGTRPRPPSPGPFMSLPLSRQQPGQGPSGYPGNTGLSHLEEGRGGLQLQLWPSCRAPLADRLSLRRNQLALSFGRPEVFLVSSWQEKACS